MRQLALALAAHLLVAFTFDATAESLTNYDEPGLSQGRHYLANNFSEVIALRTT